MEKTFFNAAYFRRVDNYASPTLPALYREPAELLTPFLDICSWHKDPIRTLGPPQTLQQSS